MSSPVVKVARSSRVAQGTDGGVDGVGNLAHFMHKKHFFHEQQEGGAQTGAGWAVPRPPHFNHWSSHEWTRVELEVCRLDLNRYRRAALTLMLGYRSLYITWQQHHNGWFCRIVCELSMRI